MDHVGIGMLGSGFIGEFHTLGLRYVPSARVVAHADANPDRRATFAERFGSRPHDSIEALCADPEVDLVVVSLPNHLHREAVLAAVAAGKGVACTKPLGRNAAEAADMLRAVTDAGVFNAYLENVVFNPDLLRLRDMVAAGSLGRLTTVRSREGHSGPHAAHFWDATVAGGGALLDMASHGTEVARVLFGKDLAATEVFAWGDTLVHRDRTTGEDNALMIIRFADGRAASCDVSWSSKGGLEGRFEAWGDAGRAVVDISVGRHEGVHRAPGGVPRGESRCRHGLGVPGSRRGPRPRPRPDDGGRRRRVSRRSPAERDVRRWVRRQCDPRRRVPIHAQRALGGGHPRRAAPRAGDRVTGRHDGVTALVGASTTWFREAEGVLRRIADTQAGPIEQASTWCADAIAATAWSTCSGPATRGSRSRRCSRATARIPGFNPIVELSMTFHTQVVGANGQRQAMFIERVPGLAEVILSNFTFGPKDVMIVFSASGLSAVPVEMARGARRRGLRVIAVTSVAQSMSDEPIPAVGSRLLDEADLVIDLCTPHADAMVQIDGLDTPVGPGSTIAAVAIVNSIKVRTAQLLVQRGAMPPVLTRASVVGADRSRDLFEDAYREHARRIARAITREG